MSYQIDVIKSLEPVLNTLVEAGLAACNGVLARAWLMGPGDVCDACPMRPGCPSQTACLHLVASAGSGGDAAAPFHRVPVGVSPLGLIPVSHEALIARADLAALGVAGSDWLTRQKVRAIAAVPLEHGGRCIGILAVYSRGTLPEEQVRLLAAATRLGAEAIGNVAAFRTLAADRNRLAAKNARLRSGLGLAPEPEPTPPSPPAPSPTPRPDSIAPSKPVPDPALALVAGALLHLDAAYPLLVRNFAEVQRDGILRALERTRWRVSGPKGAAAVLGLKPTTLESKMKKLGIHRPPR